MSQSNIAFAKTGRIARLTLCNPERHNALGGAEIDTLIGHIQGIAADKDCRVLLLQGQGESFCAGAALDELANGELDGAKFSSVSRELVQLPQPTLALLNGNVFGGGVELALACDFRLGEVGLRSFIPAARFGLCYPARAIQKMVSVLGPVASKRLLLGCEELGGAELHEIGLLTHIVEEGQLEQRGEEMAATLLDLSPMAIAAMKQLVDGFAQHELSLAAAERLAKECDLGADRIEGMSALREKRKPVF